MLETVPTDLAQYLSSIDGRPYPAYKDIAGAYDFRTFILFIDYVQGDPFAAPSKIRIRIPQCEHRIDHEVFATNADRRIATEDFFTRRIYETLHTVIGRKNRGSGKSGMLEIDCGKQEVLERTSMKCTVDFFEARMQCGLPANGRRIAGREACSMFLDDVPEIVEHAFFQYKLPRLLEHVECIENQEHIRSKLREFGLVSFIADGSILPRRSGVDSRPMTSDSVVSFRSPDSFEVELDLIHPTTFGCSKKGETVQSLRGLGIRSGVTLIVGGGYHGKSTLLSAIELGVYPHIPGDGREYCVTDPSAVKIRAEDGRRVECVNVSAFINNLPQRKDTRRFSSDDASGSTSQSANILEAVEVGCSAILLDEDTCATNFMIRDSRMQKLVAKDFEPITPFIDRVRELYDVTGVSTVAVVGSAGDFFDVADYVIMMKEYIPLDVTLEAKDIASEQPSKRVQESSNMLSVSPRIPLSRSIDASRGRKDIRIDVKDIDTIQFGEESIDIRYCEQLVDVSQARAVGFSIVYATRFMDGYRTLTEILDEVDQYFSTHSLDILNPHEDPKSGKHPGNFARPRRFEIAAAINRLRTVQMTQ